MKMKLKMKTKAVPNTRLENTYSEVPPLAED
jgi:hypothetical protein